MEHRRQERGARKGNGESESMRREIGERKQVSEMKQQNKQVLPREESAPEKLSPCASRGDPTGEA